MRDTPKKPGSSSPHHFQSAPVKNAVAVAELRRLASLKQFTPRGADPLGAEMVTFFKQTVAKRQGKLEKIAECFARLVPELLLEHCAIDSLNRGTLTVLCDSSSHLYDLRTLLLAGLQKQLEIACRSTGLRKIALKLGRWYEGEGGDRKIRFS